MICVNSKIPLKVCIDLFFRKICKHCFTDSGTMHIGSLTQNRTHQIDRLSRISCFQIYNLSIMRNGKIYSFICKIGKLLHIWHCYLDNGKSFFHCPAQCKNLHSQFISFCLFILLQIIHCLQCR